jgi:hypothetical protein
MKITSLLPTVVGGLAIALSLNAPADAFTFSFDQTSESSNPTQTGASALLTFAFQEVNSSTIRLDLEIKNTTGQTLFGDGATTSKLTGIALDLLPGLSVSSFIGDQYFDTLLTNVRFEPFSNTAVGNFSIAVADNTNFEGGNANDALPEGKTSNVSLFLTGFASNTTAASLETAFFNAYSNRTDEIDIAARFQQVDGEGSDKLLHGTPSNGSGDNGGGDNGGGDVTVPEPATVLGLSLIGGVFASTRRQKN